MDQSIIVNAWSIKDNHFICLGSFDTNSISCKTYKCCGHWLHPKSMVPFHCRVDWTTPTKPFKKSNLLLMSSSHHQSNLLLTSSSHHQSNLSLTWSSHHQSNLLLTSSSHHLELRFFICLIHVEPHPQHFLFSLFETCVNYWRTSKLSKHYVDTQAHVCHPCVITFCVSHSYNLLCTLWIW